MKKAKLISLLLLPILALAGCDKTEDKEPSFLTHDSSKWFTETELSDVGLSSLPAPTGCSGTINSDTAWFSNGYSFSQPCENEEVLNSNATIYLSYFQEHYDQNFGYTKTYGQSSDTFLYKIRKSDDLASYKGTNPSPLYKFYFVRNTETDADGFLKEDAVYSFEIRYEANSEGTYLFKRFIENQNKTKNGVYTNLFKLS